MYKRLHVSGIAPAKRGVPVLLHVFAVEIISIHAPVWGRAANLHKCKVLFMCKMVEIRDRINGKRWTMSKLVQYTAGGFVLFEQKHPGRYCANLPAYFVLPRSAQQLAYRRIGSPVCTRPVRPMVSMRV